MSQVKKNIYKRDCMKIQPVIEDRTGSITRNFQIFQQKCSIELEWVLHYNTI